MSQPRREQRSSTDGPARLASIALLNGLAPEILADLDAELEREYLPGGETLFHQGEPGDGLYAVLTGRLRVYAERAAEGDQVVGEVARGETVGGLALLTGGGRSTTVRAIRDTEVVKLSKAGFGRLLEKYPQAMMQLARGIVHRLDQRGRAGAASQPLKTIAVVPCGKDVPLREFVDRLIPLFAAIGRTLHLDKHRVESAVGVAALETPESDAERGRIAGVLNDLEGANRFVIYESDSAPSAWTRRCVRQADCILLVGHANGLPAVTDIEEQCLFRVSEDKPTARTELVLLHQAGGTPQPTGTARWYAGRRIDAHHHVGMGSKADLERLVRLLTGRAVCLVLSGGGARGFAQIGAIRALREAGIPIDYVGGTSMGAVIGAQLALGWDHDTLVRMNKMNWVTLKPLKDYTLPIVGLLSGRKTSRILSSMFGDVCIEDLPLNYFCVSSNLTRAQAEVHRRGPLWRWVRASISMPGIGPPLFSQGELYIDGGILNSLPIDVMSELCQGSVVAVYTSEPEDFPTNVEDLDAISGWAMFWNRCNPFSKNPCAPTIFSILVRAMMLSSLRSLKERKNQVDLFIDPPVREFGRFQWKAIDRLVEVGYVTAQKRIEAWQSDRSTEPPTQ